MRYFITARPGVGKSFVTEAMAARGLNAFDLEEVPGVIRLEVKATGKPAEWPEGYVDWGYYAWRMQAKPLTEFLDSQPTNQDIYVSGSTNNQADFYNLFDRVFALTLDDPAVLRHRLETRTAHDVGQSQANIDLAVTRFVGKQSLLVAEVEATGGLAIHNDRPVDEVIDDIIQASHAA